MTDGKIVALFACRKNFAVMILSKRILYKVVESEMCTVGTV